MAVIDFPDSPTLGQVYDQWTWNGTMWVLTPIPTDQGSGFTYVQEGVPLAEEIGETWYKPSTGESYVWTGTEWVKFGGGGSGFTFTQDTKPTATDAGDTWFETDTGDSFVWIDDGNSTQWVQFAPGGGSAGGYGFTFVQDTRPTPTRVGDTWFDTSTAASGGTSWIAIEEGAAGSEKVWVQFAPGTGEPVSDPPWLPFPALTSGWVNYAAPYGPAFYRKVNNIVYCKGIIQSGTAVPSNITTFPVGFRPTYEPILLTAAYNGSAECRIATSGILTVTQAFGSAPGTWLGLNNLFWPVT